MTAGPKFDDFTNKEICDSLDGIRHPFEVAVFSSQNYYNMGAILRVGHSFLCRKYWMIDFDKFYKKASMGTSKWENIEKCSMHKFLKKTAGRNIVVFEKRPGITSKSIQTFVYPKNPILFFGSEKFGVPDIILPISHSVVSIPLYGLNNDLNIAVASGIAMYDFVSKMNIKRNE